MRSRTISALLAGAVAAGCGRQEAPPDATADAPAADTAADDAAATDAVMGRTTECLNRVAGYAVRYPADWHENTGPVPGPCSLFDPEPIEVPRDSEIPIEIAIRIGFEPVPYATVAGDTHGRRELSREPATVDGRAAVRVAAESTGEGLVDAGLRSYQYFVDLGDTTMIAATWAAGSLPLERKRRILDAMMASFDFREPAR